MLADCHLYLITGDRPELGEFLEAAIAGGVDIVQIREKRLADRELLPVLERVRELTRARGVPMVVNDRPDLALLAEADAVHLGHEDLPLDAARRLGLPVGTSTHSGADIIAADDRADYLGVGPVFATPTKPGRAAVGLELVRLAARRATTPWFAIGGIDVSTAPAVVEAGATRIAVVRAIGDASDPEAAARALRTALAEAAVAA